MSISTAIAVEESKTYRVHPRKRFLRNPRKFIKRCHIMAKRCANLQMKFQGLISRMKRPFLSLCSVSSMPKA